MAMSSAATISIQFNGKAMDVPDGATIAELLQLAEIRSRLVAVEVNLDIVPQAEHQQHKVCADDVVEAVTLVGGG